MTKRRRIKVTRLPYFDPLENPKPKSQQTRPIIMNNYSIETLGTKCISYNPHDMEEETDNREKKEKMFIKINEVIKKKLTKNQKIMFLLHYKYGLSQRHIARQLKFSQAYVCVSINRCIKKIKKNIHNEEQLCLIKTKKKSMNLKKSLKKI